MLDDEFNNFGSEISANLANIESRINRRLDNLVGVPDTKEEGADSDVEMKDDGELEVDESESQGSSADSALPGTNVTATSQSPPKKQKETDNTPPRKTPSA